ncbi:uncharacterized protein LOC135931232 [Gordionus sp. m RMFG-2023]|uniref:uncharacterized protein LOC135931232 n=1 Tax=Gordionus sp. m RMFG-2023 TaxID=3053472 RepID=UPI0031FC0A84
MMKKINKVRKETDPIYTLQIRPQIGSRPLLTTEASTIPNLTSYSIKIRSHLHLADTPSDRVKACLLTTEAATIPNLTSYSIKIRSHLHLAHLPSEHIKKLIKQKRKKQMKKHKKKKNDKKIK